MLYVTPRLLLKIDSAQKLCLREGAQVPVAKRLYGSRDEKVNLPAGLALRF